MRDMMFNFVMDSQVRNCAHSSLVSLAPPNDVTFVEPAHAAARSNLDCFRRPVRDGFS